MATMFVRNAAGTGWLNAASASGFKIRNAANTGWIDRTGSLSGVQVRNAANTGWLSFGGGSPTYSVSPSAGSVAEGGTVSFTVSAPSMGSGTLYWTNAGSTVGADFSDGQNSGSVAISGGVGTISRTLAADGATEGTETIVLQLRTGSTGGTIVATASTVNVTDTGGSVPTQLSLAQNGLDFLYAPTGSSGDPAIYNDLIATVDTSNFYSSVPDPYAHVVFALDCSGGQGSNNPHSAPIMRNGANLWAVARGFIILGDGSIKAEQWNGTFSPAFLDITNTSGTVFNPAANPVFTVRIKAGYRTGLWANTMTIEVRAGAGIYGPLLFSGVAPGWGWDWSGSHKVCMAIIGGFVAPSGPTEDLSPRPGSGATVPFTGFDLRLF